MSRTYRSTSSRFAGHDPKYREKDCVAGNHNFSTGLKVSIDTPSFYRGVACVHTCVCGISEPYWNWKLSRAKQTGG